MIAPRNMRGLTLVELLISLIMAGLILAGLQGMLSTSQRERQLVLQQTDLNRDARFAMQRMLAALRDAGVLLLPLADNPATSFDESIREETVPASPPQGSSLLATAVLAVTLGDHQDIDADGIADADNDGDGRIDEDPGSDLGNDGASGIPGIDDDGDGLFDEAHTGPGAANDDDDEDGLANEDAWSTADDDGDRTVDEDAAADRNADTRPGRIAIDDDGDGSIDEGSMADDDEDGLVDEDWLDPVVFYLQGSTLFERRPVPWDENGDTVIDGRDYVASAIAEQVTRFRVQRIPVTGGSTLVDIALTLSGGDGIVIDLQTRSRVGQNP